MSNYARATRAKALLDNFVRRGHDVMVGIDLIAEVQTELDTLREAWVTRARQEGRSWTEIGAALGVSKQAAQQRYAPKKPTVDRDSAQLTIEDA